MYERKHAIHSQEGEMHSGSVKEIEDDAAPFLTLVEQDPADLCAVKFKTEFEVCAANGSVPLSQLSSRGRLTSIEAA